MPHKHTWHQQPKMVSLFVIFGQWLGHGYTKGNWWLLDMIWRGIPEGKEREERDLWVNWDATGGHRGCELSDSHAQSRNARFAGIPPSCRLRSEDHRRSHHGGALDSRHRLSPGLSWSSLMQRVPRRGSLGPPGAGNAPTWPGYRPPLASDKFFASITQLP